MTKIYKPLPTIPLTAGTPYSQPSTPPEIVRLTDPAFSILFDFESINPVTIASDATITEAAMEMRVCHTHLLLVTNKENTVVGLISSEDILGEKPLKITLERRIKRAEILVRMVMTPQDKIVAIDFEELNLAKVGDIIETLHHSHQHYALVVELNSSPTIQTIRGMFSLHQISKQLGHDVTFDLSEAQSIYELQHGFKNKK